MHTLRICFAVSRRSGENGGAVARARWRRVTLTAGFSQGVRGRRGHRRLDRDATTAPFSKLVRELVAVIGRKLTAYIAGVKDVRALDRWMDGVAPYKNAEERLRFAFRVV